MSKPVLILSFISLLAIPLFGEWQGEVRVSETDYNSYANNNGGWGIAADDDSVYLAWSDYYSYDELLFHSFPIGDPPAAPVSGIPLCPHTVVEHRYPSLAVGAGNVHVDWWEKWSNVAYYDFREHDGSSWGNFIRHGLNTLNMSSPVIADDASGNTHCVFDVHYLTTGKIYYQRRDSGSSSFGDIVLVYDPGYCKRRLVTSLCVTSDNDLHVVWKHTNRYELGYAESGDGVDWSASYIPGTRHDFKNNYAPSICHDDDDNLYVAYRGYDSPYQITVVKRENGVWTDPVVVSQNDNHCYTMSICCDGLGNIWVVWGEYHTAYRAMELAYNRLPAGADFATGWEGSQPLTVDDRYDSGDYVDISADGLGNVHVYWDDERNGLREIYYNWFQGALPKDVGVVCINAPADTVWTGYAYTPQATVANLEEESASFDVACVFELAGTVVYSDVVTVTDLAGSASTQVSFADWTPIEGIYTMTVATLLEGDGNPSNDTLSKAVIAVPEPKIQATVDFDPDKLNFKSKGKWMTCHIELEEGYSVEDIDLNTVAITKIDGDALDPPLYRQGPTGIGDYDEDGISDLMVKFDRQALIDILKSMGYEDGDEVELTVAGELTTGKSFEGTDVIEVLDKGKKDEPEEGGILSSGPLGGGGSTIEYSLPEPGNVQIAVYDPAGRKVITLLDAYRDAGSHTLTWDGCNDSGEPLPAGVYFLKFTAGELSQTARLVILR